MLYIYVYIGTPQAVVIAGQCVTQGHKKSVYYNATDNPCGANATLW